MFEEFWKLYPRKVSKRVAEKSWSKMDFIDRQAALDALPNHIKYWDLIGTDKQFIPHASTWLNQARWEDELEMPVEKPQKTVSVAWWATEQGVLAKGREIGVLPRPGEDMGTYKARLSEAIRKSA